MRPLRHRIEQAHRVVIIAAQMAELAGAGGALEREREAWDAEHADAQTGR